MGFGEAVKVCFRKYVGFDGRARRVECWWFFLFTDLVDFAARILDRILLPRYTIGGGLGPILGLVTLALLLPNLAVFARRLHDIDRTGSWMVGFYVALAVSALAAGISVGRNAGIALVFLLTMLAVCIWAIVWLVEKGTAGPNRYGPDPLAGAGSPNPTPLPAE